MRMIGLILTALLVAFQLWYTSASAEGQARVPAWVRVGADQLARGILWTADEIGDLAMPPAKRAWRETREAFGWDEPEAPRVRVEIGMDLSGADRRAAPMAGASLLGARIGGADFTKAYMRGAQLDGASGERAVFDGAVMERASLAAAQLPDASLAGADLTRAKAQAVRLPRADLSDAVLTNADLTGGVLTGAVMRGARLGGASLFRADLSGADLTGAVGVTQQQLDGACGDAETRLPDGLNVPPCLPDAL